MASPAAPGDEIEYVVTFLEMTTRPRVPIPAAPTGKQTALLRATEPPVGYFLYLYRTVGAAHEWTDITDQPEDDVATWLGAPGMSLYTLMVDGWPGGFFLLDAGTPGQCDLAYFGLVPQAIGLGLGHWLLATAVDTAWDLPGVERVTVNTNTLDHPRALGLYQKIGFVPIRRETHRRRLTGASSSGGSA